ncbi:MAG: chromosome partitioning protein [Elusimicrobia bacterium]|nr:MAG: chromosome partitioning protein [Elusimicrobiota bacterium]
MPTKDEVLKALSTCIEPELGKDIVSLGMVQNLTIDGTTVSFDYKLTTPACPLKDKMDKEAREALETVDGIESITINMMADVQKDVRLGQTLPSGIKNLVAVGSGKGGVGKSSIAANLAVALAKEGAKVGLMDADVYGPNQPQMFGVTGYKPEVDSNNKIKPPENHGVKIFSMGFLMKPDQPAIWRGPMLHGAIQQFLKDVLWGELDYLIIDLPPGTGDVQLSLCQAVPLVGSVIVTTPQSVALSDVRKAIAMFKKLNVPILGLIENMSEFVCPHCKTSTPIFAKAGAKDLADEHRIPYLGEIPLDPEICVAAENGTPALLANPESPTSTSLRLVARLIAAQVSLQNHNRKALKVDLVTS